jgi:tetratricopeptide (TPR) repeat protein
LILGLCVGAWAAKKGVPQYLYIGVEPAEAATELMQLAVDEAGNGSWERIRVARVYLLGGQTEAGQAILDEVLGRDKLDGSDWIRIGRLYRELGNWDAARVAFEKVVALKPKDEDWLAEIGAYYNLEGDRARAEELFARSFEQDPDEHRNLAAAAGSYLGVEPR